jgi:sulfate transport system permease protein
MRSHDFHVRPILIALALGFVGLFLLLPVVLIFSAALERGPAAYLEAIARPDARSAIALTLEIAGLSVAANTAFGIAAAWALTKFDFRGKRAVLTAIDLPLAVSPVISGMVFVLLFGAQGLFGPWLAAHDLKIIFAVPGMVLATVFVTLPSVARELIPVFEAEGVEAEEAAVVLGARGLQVFLRVTLPGAKWGLLYGVVLANARAMGEFGAVSVVSGHIRGATNTLPLHVEQLYNEYDFTAAFAVASLLVGLALVTLILKRAIEIRIPGPSRTARVEDENPFGAPAAARRRT